MESSYDPNSFYPYRVQEEHGSAPEIKHRDHPVPPPRRFRVSPVWIVVAVLGAVSGFVLVYNNNARERQRTMLALTPSPTMSPVPTPTFTPTPTQRMLRLPDPTLQSAYDRTVSASSMKAAFVSDVRTRRVISSENREETIESRVEGYLFGASDGSPIQTELRITFAKDPNRTAFFGQILVEDQLYMKTNTDLWVKRDKSDYNKLYENQPIDATAYAYNMLDTLFTNHKALLRGIDESSIRREGDEDIEGKRMTPFSFSLNIGEYIAAMERDDQTAAFSVQDARAILRDARVNGTLYVDSTSGYIARITLTGTNLVQISTQESEQLGVSASHDMAMLANLVDYNAPLTLQAPPEDQTRQ
jgi:hypothetical protein